MLLTYWNIGRHIIEFEPAGHEKAIYGSKILERLSRDLSDHLVKSYKNPGSGHNL